MTTPCKDSVCDQRCKIAPEPKDPVDLEVEKYVRPPCISLRPPCNVKVRTPEPEPEMAYCPCPAPLLPPCRFKPPEKNDCTFEK